MALSLATIIRDAILKIGELRSSSKGRREKAQRLFEYIISSAFQSRFSALAECVEELRDNVRKEKDWHSNTWEAREGLHDRIETCRREIAAKLTNITMAERRARLRVVHAAV
jgi:hypothetical protein